MEEDKIKIKENKDGGSIVTIEDSTGLHFYNLIVNKSTDSKKNYKSSRKGVKGNVVIPALILTILLSAGEIYGVNAAIEHKNAKAAKELEEENIKRKLDYNIDNADLSIVRMFFDEALGNLADVKDNNLEAKNVYNIMYSELLLADKSDYALHIKEGAKQASAANIYFGVGKYEKYLHAKNYNGIVYFPLDVALPTYSLEEISGDIVITYLPSDTTPYVSAADLEEFKKSREIENYMNSL